ncbi:MAG: hypothetical protein AABW41_02995 [Nanoarchaeota archaeon]
MLKRKRTKKQEAARILQNVPGESVFWAKNGAVLRNVEDLALNIGAMSNEQYSHHVNYEKNDFSSWLREVVKDEILAKDIMHARNKESAVKKVRERIALLRGMTPKDA